MPLRAIVLLLFHPNLVWVEIGARSLYPKKLCQAINPDDGSTIPETPSFSAEMTILLKRRHTHTSEILEIHQVRRSKKEIVREMRRSEGELLIFYLIGIPHSYGRFERKLSHQETIHPSKSELDKFYSLCLQMLGQRGYR